MQTRPAVSEPSPIFPPPREAKALAGIRPGLVLLVILVRLPSLFEPAWYSDEGFFTAIAWAMSHGVPLYAGAYDNSPPVVYWLFRLAQTFGSLEHHAIVQMLATAAATGAALLTFEVSRRFLLPWSAALAAALTGVILSLPVLDGDLINVELVALPFFLAALLLAFSRRDAGVLASGALLGVAIATRPSFLLDACALAIPLLGMPERWLRQVSLAVGGALLTAAVVAAALAAQGSLAAYLAIVLPADRAYLVWSNGGTYLPLLVRLAALAAASVIGFWRATTPAGRFAAIWLPAAWAGASLTPRELSHYSHEVIAPVAFTVAMAVGRVPRPWLTVVPAALAVIAIAEATLIIPAQETALINGTPPPPPFLHNFSYQGLPAYYGNWLQLVLGREQADAYIARFPGAADRAEATFLKSRTGSAGSRLIVVGDRPWLYVKTGMLPGSRYIATNSAFGRVPSAPGELAAAVRNACAGFVVVDDDSGNWLPDLEAGGYVRLSGAPLPTYRSTRRPGDCS